MSSIEENLNERKSVLQGRIQLLEQELEIVKKASSVELTDEESRLYEQWNGIAETLGMHTLYKDGKDYLVKSKNSQIALLKRSFNSLVCQEKGHDESIQALTTHGAWVYCKRCNENYTRPMNNKEFKEWEKLLSTPLV